jgi:hypothetical protein
MTEFFDCQGERLRLLGEADSLAGMTSKKAKAKQEQATATTNAEISPLRSAKAFASVEMTGSWGGCGREQMQLQQLAS